MDWSGSGAQPYRLPFPTAKIPREAQAGCTAAMTSTGSPAASFPWGFDASFSFGPDSRSRGYFGRDVLAGLISGIDDFRAEAAQQWKSRAVGPAMLGAFVWFDD